METTLKQSLIVTGLSGLLPKQIDQVVTEIAKKTKKKKITSGQKTSQEYYNDIAAVLVKPSFKDVLNKHLPEVEELAD